MADRMTVTNRDLRAMLRLVASPDDENAPEPLPWSVLAGLQELISCDTVTFVQFDAQRREVLLGQEISDAKPGLDEQQWNDALRAFWSHYWNTASCCYPDVTGDLVSVTRQSDFYTDRELHALPMYADYLKAVSGEREMMLCLPSTPGRVVRLLFWRTSGRDFSERDRGLLTLLRPHLHTAFQRRRSRPCSGPLTLRQVELLRLVAIGFTNSQIARRLSIAEPTVRKHLEHVFERLQVTSRTAAVTRAFGQEPFDAISRAPGS